MEEKDKTVLIEHDRSNSRERKYLSFSLKNEEHGVSILKVDEIVGMIQVAPLPLTPAYVKGVINLRGKVIPVIDL